MSPLPAVPAHAALHTSATASSVKLPRFSPPHTLPVQCFCLRKAFACVLIDVQARARSSSVDGQVLELGDADCGVRRLFVVLWRLRDR